MSWICFYSNSKCHNLSNKTSCFFNKNPDTPGSWHQNYFLDHMRFRSIYNHKGRCQKHPEGGVLQIGDLRPPDADSPHFWVSRTTPSPKPDFSVNNNLLPPPNFFGTFPYVFFSGTRPQTSGPCLGFLYEIPPTQPGLGLSLSCVAIIVID